MKIKEGSSYKCRDGSIVEDAKQGGGTDYYPWIVGAHSYTDDGCYMAGKEHPYDLVQEVTVTPVEPEPETKTVREWLETLPDGYRDRALSAAEKWPLTGRDCVSLSDAISGGFSWIATPEKVGFWSNVAAWAINDITPLPPLPDPGYNYCLDGSPVPAPPKGWEIVPEREDVPLNHMWYGWGKWNEYNDKTPSDELSSDSKAKLRDSIVVRAYARKKQPTYMEIHKASGLKVGDRVKVLRTAESYEKGWHGLWVDGMDKAIGKIRAIVSDSGDKGFYLQPDADIKPLGFGFPAFVLEKVEPEPRRGKPGEVWASGKGNAILLGKNESTCIASRDKDNVGCGHYVQADAWTDGDNGNGTFLAPDLKTWVTQEWGIGAPDLTKPYEEARNYITRMRGEIEELKGQVEGLENTRDNLRRTMERMAGDRDRDYVKKSDLIEAMRKGGMTSIAELHKIGVEFPADEKTNPPRGESDGPGCQVSQMRPSPKPHNPDGLTDEQIGVKDGWRLLDKDEIRQDCHPASNIPVWDRNRKRLYAVERRVLCEWRPSSYGSEGKMTYRTKLTREELRQARGLA